MMRGHRIGRRRAATAVTALAVAVLSGCAQPAAPRSGNPFAGRTIYIDPTSAAARYVATAAPTGPARAALTRIATTPTFHWFGSWSTGSALSAEVRRYVSAARASHALPVAVVYAIPRRDCDGQSGGGTASANAYRSWIQTFVEAIGSRRPVVILEPDALAQLDCLHPTERAERVALIRYAVQRLDGVASVYLDAGHAGWVTPAVMAGRLRAAGVADVRGFALNVSAFDSTATETAYGLQVSRLAGGKPFVIDTSRNGHGSAGRGQWCNPPNRALGHAPTARTSTRRVDAYVWIKEPGVSDGSCGPGQPVANTFWPSYAIALAGG